MNSAAKMLHSVALRGLTVTLFAIQGRATFVTLTSRHLGQYRDAKSSERPVRIATPSPTARPDADILFLDMLDVGRSYWTEQVLQTARKHPDSPLLQPSGDPESLDSHRVFNGGNILEEGARRRYLQVQGVLPHDLPDRERVRSAPRTGDKSRRPT